MRIKSKLIQYFSAYVARDIGKWQSTAIQDQNDILTKLISKAKSTVFGKDHQFGNIANYEDFKKAVPVRDYEGIRSYIEKIIEGQQHVLWPGVPKYFAKTSGTTSGVKYIPVTHDSIPNHINTARNALLNYIHISGNGDIFDGNVIFLSGSPELELKGSVKTGRLSGIVNHEVPAWVRPNQLPSYATNCIEDWESKLEKIVEETIQKDMRLISGIPPWVQMYYERLLEKSGKKTILEIFPNYRLFMYGGVNHEPYRTKLEQLVGQRIDSIETFPASEGFIAFQNDLNDSGLLLNTRSGIFFEFVPLHEIHNHNPVRLSLKDVELNRDYALIINNNAGLWGYDIGDCVRFVSLRPYKIIVSGRVKHYISAFGEHVIAKEVEEAMLEACAMHGCSVVEFTVAPQVNPAEGGQPYHEWWVEFATPPADIPAFTATIDQAMCRLNIYYNDLIEGKVLKPLVVRILQKDAFRDYMKSQGKLGGQNKVPRLSNDRKIADALVQFTVSEH
jgi:hypothetical protein